MAHISWPAVLPDTNPFNHLWDTVEFYPSNATNVSSVTVDGGSALEFTASGTSYDILGYPTSSSLFITKGSDLSTEQASETIGGVTYSYTNHLQAQASILTGIETVSANLAQDLSNQWQQELNEITNS